MSSLFSYFGYSQSPAPQQQQQQQQQLPQQQAYNWNSAVKGIRRLETNGYDPAKPLAAVILSFGEGSSSYDTLFQTVKQTPPSPEFSVSVFELPLATCTRIFTLLKQLDQNLTQNAENIPEIPGLDALEKEILHDIKQVEPESVLFNFECCSSCESASLGILSELVSYLLTKGYYVMFGDFSLKLFLRQWDTNILGNRLLQQTGVCSGKIKLTFDRDVLKQCPSAQLRAVGELSASQANNDNNQMNEKKGVAVIHAMSSTIVYELVDEKVVQNQKFDVEVLTRAFVQAEPRYGSSYGSPIQQNQLENVEVEEEKKGEEKKKVEEEKEKKKEVESKLLGHVLLLWKEGNKGKLLLSAGHWLELTHLETSVDSALQWAEKCQGKEYAQKLKKQWESAPLEKQSEMVQGYCSEQIQQMAPNVYCQSKSKSFFKS